MTSWLDRVAADYGVLPMDVTRAANTKRPCLYGLLAEFPLAFVTDIR